MERRVFALGVAFGFTGVMALASAVGIPIGPGAEAAGTPEQLAAPVLAAPVLARAGHRGAERALSVPR